MSLADQPTPALRRLIERLRLQIEQSESSRADDESKLQRFGDDTAETMSATIDRTRVVDNLIHVDLGIGAFPASSKSPLGRLWHRVIGRTVRRDTALVMARLEALRAETLASMNELCAQTQRLADEANGLAERNSARVQHIVLGEFANYVREGNNALDECRQHIDATSAQVTRTTDELQVLLRSTSEIHAWISDRDFDPPFSNISFGDRFRGSREEILLRYDDIADRLVATGGPMLDLGCGRGELIELVIAKGGEARGAELDPELVKFCRSIFLDVREANALEALLAEDDDSLGSVALIQVIEHLTPQQLVDLLPVAHRKLRKGGLLVAETPNGTSPFIYTRSFYCDPTHTNPVHHEYFTFALQQVGFEHVDIQWRSAVADIDRIPSMPTKRGASETDKALIKQLNERVLRINQFLFPPQDYLAVARK